MNITYRAGRMEDCPKLGELVNIASDGVVEFLFHDLIARVTPVQIVAHNMESDGDHHSFRNTIVAEYEQKVIGMALYYHSRHHVIGEEMKAFVPVDRLEHLKHILTGRVEKSLYLDTLCVDEKFRGKGVGGELISLTKKKAREDGLNALSLIALADNTDAHRLYKRCGFEIVSPIKMAAHELIPHEGGAFLMSCRLE